MEETVIVTPTGTPTNGIKTVTDSSSYAEITVIEINLPAGTVPTSSSDSFINDSEFSTSNYPTPTSYFVPVTYTPMASCSSRYSQTWALTTNIPVSIPYLVRPAITPLSTLTSTTTYTAFDDKLSRVTQKMAILNPTDIPISVLASLSTLYSPPELIRCFTPTSACYTMTRANGILEPTCTSTFTHDRSDPNSINYPYDEWSPRPASSRYFFLLIIIGVPLGWLLLFFLLGLVESWFSFKGLMLGKQRKRGTPYTWCCVNFLTLCCVGPTYKAKSEEEQAILGERWKALKAGEKLRLWGKWGFKWSYPDVLGEAPEIDRRALRQRCL